MLRPFFDEIVEDGRLTRDGDILRLTESGQVEVVKIVTALRGWLVAELAEWLPGAGAEIAETARVDAALNRIVVRLVRENENELEPAGSRLPGLSYCCSCGQDDGSPTSRDPC